MSDLSTISEVRSSGVDVTGIFLYETVEQSTTVYVGRPIFGLNAVYRSPEWHGFSLVMSQWAFLNVRPMNDGKSFGGYLGDADPQWQTNDGVHS